MLQKMSIRILYLVTPASRSEVIDQVKNEGDNASFTCQSKSAPISNISWYFNYNLVDETNVDKYDISQLSLNTTTISSTLTIMNVESSDVGTYTCIVANGTSTYGSSGVLTVNGELYMYLIMLWFINY